LISSEKSRFVEWATASHISLTNTLKRRGPRKIPDEHRRELQRERKNSRNTDLRFPVG
jgi:hypothetical protein